MKYNILIYGTGKGAKDFIEKELDCKKVNILAFVESIKTKEEYQNIQVVSAEDINSFNYDLIIVASTYVDEIKSTLMLHGIDMENCVFLREIYSYKKYNRNINNMLLAILSDNGKLEKYIRFINGEEKDSKYSVVEVDGLTFLGKGNDYIPEYMALNQKVYSEEEIRTFLELADKYYDCSKSGYFFDCGCNILTTAAYALFQRNNLKSVAFEPIRETYNIARVNAILNGLEDRITLVNKGLSNKSTTSYMSICEGNCGGNSIVNEAVCEKENEYEKISTVTLDEWCSSNGIPADEISYIWIDAEGYEGYIIDGAMNLLSRKKTALYLEFNVTLLKKCGCFELLLENLSKLYSGFIIVEMGGQISRVNSIDEIRNIEESYGINLFMLP